MLQLTSCSTVDIVQQGGSLSLKTFAEPDQHVHEIQRSKI